MKKQIELTPEEQGIVSRLPNMQICEIAVVVSRNWKPIHYSAVPYVEAMHSMVKISDQFGADDGVGIVTRFVGNAHTWKGPLARAVKAELNSRIKG